jgi:hypothetical protein
VGGDDNVSTGAAALIAIDSGNVAFAPEASWTCAVEVNVPAAVGVPVMVPALDSVNPVGNAPEMTDHV